MEPQIVMGVLLGALALLLLAGEYVFAALGIAGVIALVLIGDIYKITGNIMWFTASSWDLISFPLFVLMGEVISRSGISESLYRFASQWLARLPGGLLHANVITAALFASVSGSTIATTTTIGAIAIPEQTKLGYNFRLVIGSVAASGLLGILIPPSINMIIYAVWVEMSIGKLFMGGVLPGIILAFLFMLYIGFVCWRNPALTPRMGTKLPFAETLRDIRVGVVPLALLFAIIWGGIFSGWMTATEAAGVAAVVSGIFAAVTRRLSWTVLRDSVRRTLHITSMVMAILIGAKLVAAAIAFSGVTQSVVNLVRGSGLGTLPTLFILYAIYIVLGCFLDGISMMLLTLPFVIPILQFLGVDLLWFGVTLVVLIEIGLLTPPVGISLFVVSGLAHTSVEEVTRSVLPFLIVLFVMLLLITFFPGIVTFLPRTIMG